MTIKLYNNRSDLNVIDKDLLDIATLTGGSLLNSTEFINPVIRIKCTDGDAVNCNYLYIQEFGRYYYAKGRVVANGLFEFDCKVDVLMSWWENFKECECIIERNENLFNTYLDDGTFKAYQNPVVVTKKFKRGLTANEFILITSGGSATTP